MLPYTLILGIIAFIGSALLVRSFAKRGLMLDYDAPNSAEFRIKSRESSSEHKTRPAKIYDLAKPIDEIINCIGSKTKNETQNKLALFKKIRDYLQ